MYMRKNQGVTRFEKTKETSKMTWEDLKRTESTSQLKIATSGTVCCQQPSPADKDDNYCTNLGWYSLRIRIVFSSRYIHSVKYSVSTFDNSFIDCFMFWLGLTEWELWTKANNECVNWQVSERCIHSFRISSNQIASHFSLLALHSSLWVKCLLIATYV